MSGARNDMDLHTVTQWFGGTAAAPHVVLTLIMDEDDRVESKQGFPSSRIIAATVERKVASVWRVYICDSTRTTYYCDSKQSDGLGKKTIAMPISPLYAKGLIIGGCAP